MTSPLHDSNPHDSVFIKSIVLFHSSFFAVVILFYFQLLQVWSATEHEQEEYLDSLWTQISKLRDDGWVERHISRYYVAFDGSLAGTIAHNLPL